jgi:SAM-dependent methyltransferase
MADFSRPSARFACPLCKTPLVFRSESFFCAACRKDWPATNGLVDLRASREGYWGVYPEGRLIEINARSAEIGWADALKEFFSESDPDYYEYILDDTRAHWHFLVPLGEDARILDAGCGWGTLSFALAKLYREVVALDASRPQIEFIERRRRSEKIDNLSAVCGQIAHLPFEDETFDLVVLNGVLEWVPSIDAGKSPGEVQAQALREVYRVLKKNGHLYLAIENRWSAMNFLGYPDTHSGLRFAPLLPRALANAYSRLIRKKDFREYTYTYGEHKRLLKEAGFSCVQFYAPLPSYRRFHYLIPVEDASRVRFFVNRLIHARNNIQAFFVGLVRSLRLYRWVKYFVPDFSIIARK